MHRYVNAILLSASLLSGQFALAPPALTNSAIENQIRRGTPTSSIIQAILAAPEVDLLVNNYEFGRLTGAGASNRDADFILEAMHQRLIHPPRAALPIVATSPAGPELYGAPIPPAELSLRRPGPRIILEDATPVKLRLSRNLSSEDARAGETIDFEVLEQITVEDRIVVPKGSLAWGTVTVAEPKKRMARGGKLDLTIDNVRLADGEKAALRGSKQSKGGGHTGGMATGMVITSLFFWPAAPAFLLMEGKDITIPKGAEITAYTNGEMQLDGNQFRFAPVAREQ